MVADPKTVERVQKIKAEIIAQTIFPKLEEDDTSAEVMDMAQEMTNDETVVEMVIDLIEKMVHLGDEMNADPGHQEAEEILQQAEDDYYGDLADQEG